MKYLLTQDIDGADWGRVVADENGVFVKGFDFDFSPYKLIDLGLPSGTLWADRNIGAASPEDSGLYFQWGDTKGYTAQQCNDGEKAFTWDNYKYGNPADGFTKYLDKGDELSVEDDAAIAETKTKLRMPTKAEMEELFELEKEWVIASRDTTSDPWGEGVPYTNVEDANVREGEMNFDERYNTFIEETSTKKFLGINFVGKNDNKLFVPAAGYCGGGFARHRGYGGSLWSSSLGSGDVQDAVHGIFGADGNADVGIDYRYSGYSVRGVATAE